MPRYTYECRNDECRNCEVPITPEENIPIAQRNSQVCPECGLSLALLPSPPAPTRVGKYGKGNPNAI